MSAARGPADPAALIREFAEELRRLRESAGSPTFRVMRERSGLSLGALNQATRGEALPSLRVTRGFVTACGGDPRAWEERRQAVKAELDGQRRPDDPDSPPPYRGLARFEPEQADLFFGRSELVARLHALTRRFPVTAVFGPSGSGKSSLLRAGLIPALRGQGSGTESGSGADAPAPAPAGIRILTPGPRPATTHAERLVPHDREGETFVLVDQFEEVFTLCRDDAERTAFLDALLAAGEPDSRLRVVLAVRADFLGHCARHAGLTAVLQEATLLVGPMSGEELRQAVVRPAAVRGFQVQRSLTGRVIREVEGEPGALPLMSHALLETWRHRRGHMLTEAAYESAGGLHGAIAQTAEEVYRGFSAEEAEAARRVLLRLVAPGDGAPDTRRPVDRAELGAATEPDAEAGTDADTEADAQPASAQRPRSATESGPERASGQDPAPSAPAPSATPDVTPSVTASVVDRLVAARLLTSDDGVVDLAHEALITAWPRLRAWIDAERGRLLVHRQLTAAAGDWEALEHDPGALYRGSRLEAAAEAFPPGCREDELTPPERDFLTASLRLRDRAVRIRQGVTAALVALCVIATTAAVVAFQQRATAHAERNDAVFHQTTTQADKLRGTRRSLSARLDLAAQRMRATPDVDSRLIADAGATLSSRLPGHRGVVSAADFTPDGNTLASAGHDRTVRLWNTADPLKARPLRAPLTGLTERAEDVRFSADGALLAVSLHDGTVRLWDTRNPRRPEPVGAPLKAHSSAVAASRFSPDGSLLATAGDDGTVRLWDLSRPSRPRPLGDPLSAHQGGVQAVEFAPDGGTLVSGGHDDRVRLWDVGDPAHAEQLGDGLRGHGAPVWSVAFSPDGKTVASGGFDETVRLWDVSDPRHVRQRAVRTEPRAPVWSVAFSPDGRTLAAGGEDNAVRQWNVADPDYPQPLGEALTGHSSGIWRVAFRPDGTREGTRDGGSGAGSGDGSGAGSGHTLVSAGYEGDLLLWHRPRTVLTDFTNPLTAAAFGPGRRLLATASTDDGLVRLWDVRHPRRARLLAQLSGHHGKITSVAFARDGRTLASGSDDGTVRLWDVSRPSDARPLGKPLAGHGGGVLTVAFAPRGERLLAAAGEKGTVRLWHVPERGRPSDAGTVDPGDGQVNSLAFARDGRTLAGATERSAVVLWRVGGHKPPRPLRTLTGHRESVGAVAFSPDGRTLASGGDDRTVRLWNVAGSVRAHPAVRVLKGHEQPVRTVAFSPDGERVASGGDDETVRLWDVADPAHARAWGQPLTGHTGSVSSVAFAPDGSTLASAGFDLTARLWTLDADEAAAGVCARSRGVLTPAEWRVRLPQVPYEAPCGGG